MSNRERLIAIACVSLCAALGVGATFWWLGLVGPAWTACQNWGASAEIPGMGCYPSTSSDDAMIPWRTDGWNINLVTTEIDDLSVYASVNFGAEEAGTPTLTVDSLVISTRDSGGAAVVLTMGGACIRVPPPPQ